MRPRSQFQAALEILLVKQVESRTIQVNRQPAAVAQRGVVFFFRAPPVVERPRFAVVPDIALIKGQNHLAAGGPAERPQVAVADGQAADKVERAENPPAAERIESAYSPSAGQWEVAWPERLSQHDVVYLSPPEDPTLGLPIGNGDLGALSWTTGREVVLALNKCDIWDDGKPGPFHNWGRTEEENYTTLRHCGWLTIDLDCPAFDLLYQQDFEGRLELASGAASLRASTAFAKVAVSSYVSAAPAVLVVRCETSSAEDYSPRCDLNVGAAGPLAIGTPWWIAIPRAG